MIELGVAGIAALALVIVELIRRSKKENREDHERNFELLLHLDGKLDMLSNQVLEVKGEITHHLQDLNAHQHIIANIRSTPEGDTLVTISTDEHKE
jgi:3-phenylpropionate/cinnamic acid dioxygenase small subunit